jgi:hypothetical protein
MKLLLNAPLGAEIAQEGLEEFQKEKFEELHSTKYGSNKIPQGHCIALTSHWDREEVKNDFIRLR